MTGVLLLALGAVFFWTRYHTPPANANPSAVQTGRDAYQAACILVERSLVIPGTARFSSASVAGSAQGASGIRPQEDGTWKIWGWVDVDNVAGGTLHKTWQAVMKYQGEGRKWRALWLKIGDQESGEAAAWLKED
jgi:hypothetical protein